MAIATGIEQIQKRGFRGVYLN